MKKIAFLALLLAVGWQTARAQGGDTYTAGGTIVANTLVKINTSNQAVAATTSDTAVPVYIALNAAASGGVVAIARVGQANCVMDATNASFASQPVYITNSTTVATDCHASTTAPSAGVYVAGHIAAPSTTSGSASLIEMPGYFYPSTTGYPGAGVPVSTGSAWGTSLTKQGTDTQSPTSNFSSPATNQIVQVDANGGIINNDLPMPIGVPAANCNNATAGTGWSLPTASAPTAACRTGTNVQAGVLQFTDGQSAQFQVNIPAAYDSSGTVYAHINFTQGANTTASQTIIMQIATGCGTTDDPAFNTAQSFGTATTVTTAQTAFDETLSGVTMTGCSAGQRMNVKISRTTDTATTAPNVYFVVLTFPTKPTMEAY